MSAPICPVSRSQAPGGTRVGPAALLPSIPIATDLPSLIRAVNIMQDILRTLTTTLTVNNVWEPQTGANIYILSDFPSWMQTEAELVEGFVYYKARGQEPDKDQRAYVQRTNSVTFRNDEAGGEEFKWRLKKDLDSEFGDSKGVTPFAEDFFERIVNVKWGSKLYLYVRVGGGNSRFDAFSAPSVSAPDIQLNIIKKCRLVDEYHDPDGNKSDSANACLMYAPVQNIVVGWNPPDRTGWSTPIMGSGGEDFETAYDKRSEPSAWRRYYASSDHGSCPLPASYDHYVQASESQWGADFSRSEEWTMSFTSVPVDFAASAGKAGEYLYKISADDDILEVAVSGIIPNSDTSSGLVQLYVSVYSTVRDLPTNLEKLVDLPPYDDQTRLSPDDTRIINLDSDNQGTFKINIHQDLNLDHAQTDNYGKKYQPYKVIFDPAKDSTETIPEQPPELLPLPAMAG